MISLAVPAAGWVVLAHPEITPSSNFYQLRDTTIDRRIDNKLSAYLSGMPAEDRRQIVQNTFHKYMGFGFKQKKYLLQFCVWSLLLGPEFEVWDPTGKLGRICKSAQDEHRRFEAFAIRMSALQNVRNQNSRNTA